MKDVLKHQRPYSRSKVRLKHHQQHHLNHNCYNNITWSLERVLRNVILVGVFVMIYYVEGNNNNKNSIYNVNHPWFESQYHLHSVLYHHRRSPLFHTVRTLPHHKRQHIILPRNHHNHLNLPRLIPRGGTSGTSGSSGSNGRYGTDNVNIDNFFAAASTDITSSQWPIPSSKSIVYESVLLTLQIITTTFRTILPPIVTTIRMIVNFYRILPMDAILAQIGLIYAFAGGYYPTLFAAIQAAQHCGYQNMITAVQILIDEATTAIQACDLSSIRFTTTSSSSSSSSSSQHFDRTRARDIFTQKTKIVLATIDPVRINDAMAAIYTTWLSISMVLEREFARTIALSITIAESIRPIVSLLLNKPLQMCISSDYYKWIPIIIGWVCKALAMSLAWRVQRVLTAYTSAIAGGLLCARALCRIVQKRFCGIRRRFGCINNKNKTKKRNKNSKNLNFSMPPNIDDSDELHFLENTHLDEFLGYMIALCGLYTQIGQGFRFQVPFPLNLVTWPFDIAERWIQWQITKKSNNQE